MNQKSHNNLLKSLLLISRIRFSDLDEVSKFAKSDADRKRKINAIKKLYNKEEDKPNRSQGLVDFDKIFPPQTGDGLSDEFNLNELDDENLEQFFMSDEEYKKLADIIGEAMDDLEKEKIQNDLNNQDQFKVFKQTPSFEDLVNWFKLLLLANDGELQLTLTPGNELIMIFKKYVSPENKSSELGNGKSNGTGKRKRTRKNKKDTPPEQDNE